MHWRQGCEDVMDDWWCLMTALTPAERRIWWKKHTPPNEWVVWKNLVNKHLRSGFKMDGPPKRLHMKHANDYSGYGNAVLYRMCREQPKHESIDIISSKIWIIGRAYSATIERGAGKRMKEDKNFNQEIVAPAIRKSGIDGWIARVSSIKRLTTENFEESLNCHKKLTDLFKQITGINKRSLASKYLHFHAPYAFFIYDSIANRRVKEELRTTKRRLSYPDGYDNEYAAFSVRCMYYRDEILEKRLHARVTPRKLDMTLLNYQF